MIPRLLKPTEGGRPLLELGRVRLPVLADVEDPVSASELAVFDACEWRHRFEYVLRMRPTDEPIYFKTGKVLHAGLEAGYRASVGTEGVPLDERVLVAALASEQAVDEALARYEELADAEVRSDELRDRLLSEASEVARLVRWILPRYWRHYVEDFERYRVVEVERRGVVPLGPTTSFLFVRDLVLLERGTDYPAASAIVCDTKSTKRAPREVEKRVELDSQMTGYAYALAYELSQRFEAWQDPESGFLGPALDAKPQGVSVLYNVIRTWAPKSPKLNKDGTVSTAAIDTTAEAYQAALDAAGEPTWLCEARELGGKKATAAEEKWTKIHAAQIERLTELRGRGDDQFLRIEYSRTRAELEEWRRETELLAQRIQARRQRPDRAVRSRWVCSAPGALPCPWRLPCLEPGAPEHYEGYRVSDPYERLRGGEHYGDSQTEE